MKKQSWPFVLFILIAFWPVGIYFAFRWERQDEQSYKKAALIYLVSAFAQIIPAFIIGGIFWNILPTLAAVYILLCALGFFVLMILGTVKSFTSFTKYTPDPMQEVKSQVPQKDSYEQAKEMTNDSIKK